MRTSRNTKTMFAIGLIIVLAVLAIVPTILQANAGKTKGDYVGIDASIMEARAEEEGHAAKTPLINTDQGDILLFVFCVGGLIAGGLMGYFGRALLVEGRIDKHDKAVTPGERQPTAS